MLAARAPQAQNVCQGRLIKKHFGQGRLIKKFVICIKMYRVPILHNRKRYMILNKYRINVFSNEKLLMLRIHRVAFRKFKNNKPRL